jgi:hypothetical protein
LTSVALLIFSGLEMGKKKQNNSNNKNTSGSNNPKGSVPATNSITNYLKPTVSEDQPPKNKETTLLKNLLSKGELQGEPQKPSSSESNITPIKEASSSVENKEVKDNCNNNISNEKELDSQARIISPDSRSSPSNNLNNRAISTTLSDEDNLGMTLSTVSLSTPHSTSMKSPMVQFDNIYPESDELVRDVDCLVPNQTPIGLPRDGENDKSFHYHDTYNEIASPYIARKNEGDINDDDSLTTEPDKVGHFVSFFFHFYLSFVFFSCFFVRILFLLLNHQVMLMIIL